MQKTNHITRVPKLQTRLSTKKSPKGRPLKRWADQIRNDTRLPLLTAERNTKDRTKWVEFVRRVVH